MGVLTKNAPPVLLAAPPGPAVRRDQMTPPLPRPPRPRPSPLSWWQPLLFLAASAAVIIAMWVRHGGLGRFGSLAGDFTSIGQLTALLGALAVLVLLLLISRLPWLEHRFGLDRLNHWHRWAGMVAITLLSAHVLASTIGFAASEGSGLGRQLADFFLYYPNLLAAMVGFTLLAAVAAFSARAARRALRSRPGGPSICMPTSGWRWLSLTRSRWDQISPATPGPAPTGSPCSVSPGWPSSGSDGCFPLGAPCAIACEWPKWLSILMTWCPSPCAGDGWRGWRWKRDSSSCFGS